MDIATLVMTHAVFECSSVREAARRLDRPPATVSAAVKRFERTVAVTLIQRAGSSSLLTLEARRMEKEVATAARLAMRMIAPQLKGSAAEKFCARVAISMVALRRFLTVAEVGSVRRAARAIELGQPQLTQQIARLEGEMGTKLLRRSPTGVTLTAAGRTIVALLPEIEDHMRRLSRQAAERFRSSSATIRLATVIPLGHDSNLARLMAFLAATWQSQRRKQPLFLTSGAAEDLFAGIKDKRFDLALVDSETIPHDLAARPLFTSRLALVGARHVLTTTKTTVDLLRTCPLALPSRRTGLGQAANRLLAQLLGTEEMDALSAVEMDSIPVIANLMIEFGFLSILPESALSMLDGPLTVRPLHPVVELTLSLIWSKTDAAQRSARLILGVLRDYRPAGAA